MYVDTSPTAARRSTESARPRGDCRQAPRQQTTARRIRVDDAIVSQWLLEQLPSDHRHTIVRQQLQA